MATIILDQCTASNGTALNGRTPSPTNTPGNNWVDADDAWDIQSNKIHLVDTGLHLATVDAETADITWSAKVVIPTGSLGAGIVIRYADDSNFILALFQQSSPGGTCLFLFKRVAGSFTELDTATSISGHAVDTEYTLTLSADGDDLLTATLNTGETCQVTDAAGSANTKVGLYANNHGATTYDDLTAATASSGTITITTPTAFQARQINGSNQADIPITGTYTGTPTAIEASFNGGAYATIVASPAGGTYSGTLSNQAAGQGTLTVRFTNDTGIEATKANVTLTDVFVFAGDSRADGRLTNNQTYSGAGSVPRFRQDDAWGTGEPYDTHATGGSFAPLIANLYSALKSRPPAFITVGTGATDVAGSANQWAKNNSAYAEMATQISAAATGGVKAGLFFLGPNAIVNASTLSQATYNAAIDQLASDFAADFTTTPSANPKILVDVCGEVNTGSPPDRRAAEDNIRQGIIQAWNDNAQVPGGPVLIDQDYADDVHPVSDAEALVVSRRYWVAIETGLFGGSYGRGPRKRAIALDATKKIVTVTVDRDLASGTTYGGFRVEDSGTPATIVAATRLNARQVRIDVSSPLSAEANVAVSFGSNDDAKGQTVPTSTAVTLPDTNTITLPLEPFIDQGIGGDVSVQAQVSHAHILRRRRVVAY